MRSFHLSCRRLACIVAAWGIVPFPANAASFALGEVSSPMSFSIGNSVLPGSFADMYTFSIVPGRSFAFDAFLSTGFSRRSFIPDMQAGLYGGDGLLQSGDAATITTPEGFPSRDIGFDGLMLGPGNYELRVNGTATSAFPDVPISAAYGGSIDLMPVSTPIPEPTTLVMLSLGLALLGVVARHRR